MVDFNLSAARAERIARAAITVDAERKLLRVYEERGNTLEARESRRAVSKAEKELSAAIEEAS